MALNGEALSAILAANSAANQQALTAMGDTFAISLREKSAEDQARMDAMLQKMQDRMDKQDETMKAMLMYMDRSRRPDGSLTAPAGSLAMPPTPTELSH